MKAYQNAQLSMAKSTHGVLTSEEHESLVEDFPAVQSAMTALESKVTEAEDLILVQTDQSAAAAEKAQSRTDLVSLATIIVGAILSYAQDTSDKRLEKKASISASKLGKARDSRLVALCRGIHKTAVPLTQALKSCKITAEKITSLKTQTEDYKKSYTKPRQAIAAGKGATKRLPIVLRQTSTLLRKRLDPLMVQFKESEPEFYAKYKAARRIVKPAVNPNKKAQAKAKLKTTNVPTVTVPKAA
jgi:hypothetical protein